MLVSKTRKKIMVTYHKPEVKLDSDMSRILGTINGPLVFLTSAITDST